MLQPLLLRVRSLVPTLLQRPLVRPEARVSGRKEALDVRGNLVKLDAEGRELVVPGKLGRRHPLPQQLGACHPVRRRLLHGGVVARGDVSIDVEEAVVPAAGQRGEDAARGV